MGCPGAAFVHSAFGGPPARRAHRRAGAERVRRVVEPATRRRPRRLARHDLDQLHGGPGAARPNGEGCACSSDCQSGFCADGVCCNTACTETARRATGPGRRACAPSCPRAGAPRSRRRCPKAPATTCGLDGTCDGAGACRSYPAGTDCAAGRVRRARPSRRRACDGAGLRRPGPRRSARPTTATPHGRLLRRCTGRRRLRRGRQVHERQLRARSRRAPPARRRRLRVGLLRRRRLLQPRLQRRLRQLQPVGRAGHVLAVAAGPPIRARICRDQGAPLRQTGACDGSAAARYYAAEHRLLAPALHAATARHRRHAATASAPAARRRVQACAPFRCSDGACTAAARATPTASPPTSARAAAAARSRRASLRGRHRVRQQLLRRRRLLRRRLRRRAAAAARCPRRRASCTPSPAGAADPRGVCVDQGARRPAAPTARATARAAAASTSPARVRPRALHRRQHAARRACNGDRAPASGPTPAPAPRSPATAARCFGACTADARLRRRQRLPRGLLRHEAERRVLRRPARVRVRHLRPGRLLRHRLRGACKSCALAGDDGPVHERPRRARPIRPGRASISAPGAAAGTDVPGGRLPALPAGHACGAATCPAGTPPSHPPASCDGAGTCVTPAATSCFPFRCGVGRLQGDLHGGRRLRAARRLQRRIVRPQARRRDLRRRRRVRERHLRAGRLLQDRLRRQLHVVRDGGPRRQLRAGRGGRPRSRRPVPRPGRGELRDQRRLRRRGRLSALRGGNGVRAPVVPRRHDHRDARAHLRRRGDLQGGHDAALPALQLQRRQLPRGLRQRRRLRGGQRL